MGFVYKTHNAWKTAKGVCIAYLLSFVVGWLSRVCLQGKISPENEAALFILLVTVATIIIVFCTIGIRRWRKGQLLPWEKRLLVFSLVMFVVMFFVGWFSDIK